VPVLDRRSDRLEGGGEAVAGGLGRDDRQRRLTCRPYMACRRSACSVLVGSPVEGPPRWMSMMSRGSSRLMARPIGLRLEVDPGGRGGGGHRARPERRAERRADPRDSRPRPSERAHRRTACAWTARAGCPRRGDRIASRGRGGGRCAWTPRSVPMPWRCCRSMLVYSPGRARRAVPRRGFEELGGLASGSRP